MQESYTRQWEVKTSESNQAHRGTGALCFETVAHKGQSLL